MRRTGWIVLAALVVGAVAEVWLLAWLVQTVGLGWTLLILLAGAGLGVWLFQREGLRTFRNLFERPETAQQAGNRVTDAMLVVLGGFLLLLPGLITDALGLFCILPFTRPIARRGVQAALGAFLKPYRDQAALIETRLNPDTVVRGEAVSNDEGRRRGPDDPSVIRGEIEP